MTIDTDVTITGVYVNTSAVSSNETYCKRLQYRTAYSVTEERVVTQEIPPKSYTPLTALSSMRPPDPGILFDFKHIILQFKNVIIIDVM